jgi:hypothetical protein
MEITGSPVLKRPSSFAIDVSSISRTAIVKPFFNMELVSKPDHEKHDLLQVISRTIFSRIEGFRVQYENQSLGIYWLLELMTISGSPGVVE